MVITATVANLWVICELIYVEEGRYLSLLSVLGCSVLRNMNNHLKKHVLSCLLASHVLKETCVSLC